MNLLSKLTQRRTDAEQALNQIAKREALDKEKPGDADQLAEALQGDINTAHYEELVAFYRHVEELRAKAKHLASVEKALVTAREAHEAHGAETQRLRKERARERNRLMEEFVRQEAEFNAVKRAHNELQQLEYEYADRLGIEPIDLDEYTLMWDANYVCHYDSKAPEWQVPRETWHAECRRRESIFRAARDRAHNAFKSAVSKWEQSRNAFGQVLTDKPAPVFQLPDWAEIVKLGWNKDLDPA